MVLHLSQILRAAHVLCSCFFFPPQPDIPLKCQAHCNIARANLLIFTELMASTVSGGRLRFHEKDMFNKRVLAVCVCGGGGERGERGEESRTKKKEKKQKLYFKHTQKPNVVEEHGGTNCGTCNEK